MKCFDYLHPLHIFNDGGRSLLLTLLDIFLLPFGAFLYFIKNKCNKKTGYKHNDCNERSKKTSISRVTASVIIDVVIPLPLWFFSRTNRNMTAITRPHNIAARTIHKLFYLSVPVVACIKANKIMKIGTFPAIASNKLTMYAMRRFSDIYRQAVSSVLAHAACLYLQPPVDGFFIGSP